MKRSLGILCGVAAVVCLAGLASAAPVWLKGNTHTHTTESDGDSTPGLVARWYRNNGYDFLVLTDHNVYTTTSLIQQQIDDENRETGRRKFLLISGEEVSDSWAGPDRKYTMHMNGIGTLARVGKQGGPGKVETLQRMLDAIRAKGGLPQVNHPNFLWALTPEDLQALKGMNHFEIYNGHPSVNNLGGGGRPGTEAMWDILLSSGRRVFGMAVDDAHHFKRFARDQSNPGRGWVMVRSEENTTRGVVGALERGDYYATTGVVLDDVSTTDGALSLKIHQQKDALYRTEFIGQGGAVLATDDTTGPMYRLQPRDTYVRARVQSSNGDVAWSQPVWRDAGAAAQAKP